MKLSEYLEQDLSRGCADGWEHTMFAAERAISLRLRVVTADRFAPNPWDLMARVRAERDAWAEALMWLLVVAKRGH